MKKSVVIIFSLLLAFGLSSCGDDNSSGSNKGNGGSSSIVVPPGSITPTKPDTGDNGYGNQEGGDGGNDNQGSGNGGDGNQGSGDTPVPGGKCTEDVCNGQQALHCNSLSEYELFETCSDDKICAIVESNSKKTSGCYEKCAESDKNNPVRSCQENYGYVWSVTGTCLSSLDNKFIKIVDNSDPSNIIVCSGGCTNGECVQLDPEEGKTCDPDNYNKHCAGDALVYCAPEKKVVTTTNCKTKDGATTCAQLDDGAKCIDDTKSCTEAYTFEYQCDDSLLSESGKYSLIAYECRVDISGKYVSTRDEFFSDPFCGDSCDAQTGVCCDTATGVCNKTPIEDAWPPYAGGNCTNDVCYENKAYHCSSYTKLYEEARSCMDNEVCAVVSYDAYDFSGCYEPCTAAEENSTVSVCQSNFGKTWTRNGVCRASNDNQYVKVIDIEASDNIVMCSGSCTNGVCDKLDPEEGNSCNPSTYGTHCTGNAFIFCDTASNTVSGIYCTEETGADSCSMFNNTALCVNKSVSCSEEFEIVYTCDTSALDTKEKYNLFAYECHIDDNGNNVGVKDYSASITECGDTCNATDGLCCDKATGNCNK